MHDKVFAKGVREMIKLAVLLSHPIQYFVPMIVKLTKQPDIFAFFLPFSRLWDLLFAMRKIGVGKQTLRFKKGPCHE